MEDHDIVALYFARSEDAIRESSKKYGTYVTGISMNILQNIQDAEECVNDTWLKAWNSIPPQSPPSLKVYLGRLVRHLSIARLRTITRLKRNRELEVALDEHLETCHPGLFIIGDGSGVTHSLSQASASGIYVADQILERYM